MREKFEDYEWHDAELLSITIDRSDPGYKDEIEIKVCWPDDTKSKLTFVDCFMFKATMHFNVICNEPILDAYFLAESEMLVNVKETWRGAGLEARQPGHYVIRTNSTAGWINIVACGVREEKLG